MDTGHRRVSVVLPTYNRADVLGRSIENVLGQAFEEFEFIIVDDASTDDTDGVVEGFSDDRIQYIRHNQNKGAAAARNTGIQETETDIIAFQDSDDVWDERKLEKQVDEFEKQSSERRCRIYGSSQGVRRLPDPYSQTWHRTTKKRR